MHEWITFNTHSKIPACSIKFKVYTFWMVVMAMKISVMISYLKTLLVTPWLTTAISSEMMPMLNNFIPFYQ